MSDVRGKMRKGRPNGPAENIDCEVEPKDVPKSLHVSEPDGSLFRDLCSRVASAHLGAWHDHLFFFLAGFKLDAGSLSEPRRT